MIVAMHEALTQKEKRQVIGEHLRAMRKMLIVCVAAIAVAFLLIFYLFCTPLVDFILEPLRTRGIEVIATHVSESLIMKFKACLVAAVVAAMPVIIWQIWSFVSPALYKQEKRLFRGLFFVALLLFLLGVWFSYAFVFPLAIDLFYEAGEGLATTMWSVNQYFDFVLSFVLPFGLMFEMPVVIFMLARRGKVTYAKLTKFRKYFILVVAVVAAVLTPPDVVSQIMLLIPLLILYEISVLLARFVKTTASKEAEA